jgi:N-acetylneuraminate lyase
VCGLPLYLYHLPQVYGDLITIDKFVEAADTMPTLAGAKFSSYRIDDLINLKIKAKGKLNILSGCGEQCLSGIINGADGSICTWYNVIPRLADRIITCARNGNVAEASRCQDLLVEFAMILIARPIGNVKKLLAHRGFDVGRPRMPMIATSDEEWRKLLPKLEATGIMDWVVST